MREFIKKNIIGINLVFVILPIIIFLFGFLKLYVAIPFSIVIFICYYKILKKEKIEDNKTVFTKKEFIICAIILLIWIAFSGIGNFSYQNDDWEVRNAVLRDLVNYDWPVIFSAEDMVYATDEIKASDKIAFVYYFAYWLPAALVGKIFGLVVANIFLYIWSFLILINVVYLLKRFLKKSGYLIIFFLVFFSGIDILGALTNGAKIIDIQHIEWWCKELIQYSSNTTQLYWVFNQSVMSWLITILILSVKKKSSIMFIAPMIFAYSPFATFGMIGIAAYLIISKIVKDKENIFRLIFSAEMINVIFLIIVFGSFYLSAESSIFINGFVWNLEPKLSENQITNILLFALYYIIFCFVEFFIYAIMIKKSKGDLDGLFYVVLIELILIPLYKVTPANDFCMRASIVPLFILMIYFIKYILELKKGKKFEKVVVGIIVFLSMITPIHEISRSVYYTKNTKDYIKEDEIYSIGNPITKDGFSLCDEQFYNKNLDDNFFSKYLMRDNKVFIKMFW